LQRQHAVELRIPGAEIIDGNARTGLTITGHDIAQALAVATQFGDFKHDALGSNAVTLQLLEAGQRLVWTQTADPARGNIQAQKPVARHFMQAAKGIVADQAIKTTQFGSGPSGICEKRADRLQAAVFLTQAPQCFYSGDAARGGIDERLKAG